VSTGAGALDRRRAGILLHPTSLPGPGECGTLGESAYHFVEFLCDCAVSVWQTLPLAPTHADGSPYLATSVHAGNPCLIDAATLPGVSAAASAVPDRGGLAAAAQAFSASAPAEARAAFESFRETQAHWLEDYALFVALKRRFGDAAWWDWPTALRDREPAALRRGARELAGELEVTRYEQFAFARQWDELKRYANERGVRLFGDMPIFVAHDSADVWAQRELFDLDEQGLPTVVAGVPPDYFSATGQRWGNPHYRWQRMQADDFRWWHERMRTQLERFDLVRIDHFRGFESYWEVPAEAETAMHGRWVKAPGDALFASLLEEFGKLPLVAEDLGLITPEVDALRLRYGLPGMKILQFAFDGSADNPYLPHNHTVDSVVYTGTHDNDTTLGWYGSLDESAGRRVLDYLGRPRERMPWPLNRCALASVASLAVLPLQDVLGLGGEHRMNTPGTSRGNWQWRFQWRQVSDALPRRLKEMVHLYGRA
jgi:4-alpha-glucanotransferase